MPTYDYECDACSHRFEEFQSMNDKRLTDCPACKKPKLRRLIGAGAGIIFKGSGFYQTDYKKSGDSSPSGSSSPASSSPAKDASTSSPKPAEDKSCGSCGKKGPDVCD